MSKVVSPNRYVKFLKKTDKMINDGNASSLQSKETVSRSWFVFNMSFLAIFLGLVNVYHVSSMFENNKHFSHLSTMEREMTLRSEMGLYYSYYKTIVQSNSFSDGLNILMNDRLVEYPDVINALKRFNLYPEVIMGFLFKIYEYYSQIFGIETKQCWTVERQGHMGSITSCEGLGVPVYFYLQFVWVLAGLTVIILFIYSLYLSNSVWGALLAVICYFYNHNEATRVQWTPPLRESFAFPFILIHMMTVSIFLRKMNTNFTRGHIFQICTLSAVGCICLVLWQFSQFVLSTQLMVLFIMDQIKIINKEVFSALLFGHIVGIYIAVIIMQGNKMLMSSVYFSLASGISFNCLIWNYFPSLENNANIYSQVSKTLKNLFMVLLLSVAFKLKFSSFVGNDDDSHIFQLLKSKFTTFKDFHTMLYTCSTEFNYLQVDVLWNLSCTFLLPCVTLSGVLVCSYWWLNNLSDNAKRAKKTKTKRVSEPDENPSTSCEEKKCSSKTVTIQGKSRTTKKKGDLISESSTKVVNQQLLDDKNKCDIINKKKRICNEDNRGYIFGKCESIEPEVFFNFAILGVYLIMAMLIMRLKLFLTPQLCIMASLISSQRYIKRYFPPNHKIFRAVFMIAIIFIMSIKGVPNVVTQRKIIGEFSNEPLEELLTWVEKNTEKTASFAGPMPITSAILLSTRRPIVNHPHYEDSKLRIRTKIIYSMFSRQSPTEVYAKLSKLKITYLVVDELWCFYKSAGGCTLLDIWDVEEPHMKDRTPLCPQLFLQSYVPHFQRVFSNSQFVVLKLHDNVVNVKMPIYPSYSI